MKCFQKAGGRSHKARVTVVDRVVDQAAEPSACGGIA